MQSFRQQTYQNRELLILWSSAAAGDHPSIADDVRIVVVYGRPPIGIARNLGCEQAHGEIICHWDDDDYSAPNRITDQVGRLLDTGKAVTGYSSMRFTDGRRNWQYSGSAGYALGTSLCYRRDFWQVNRFPPEQVGEDNSFVARARARGAIVSVDAGDLMFATIHGGNTSPRQLTGGNWRQI